MSSACDNFILEDQSCEWFELVQYVENFDMGINFLEGPPGPPGPAGEAIFIPSVSEDGWISWTNTAGLPNPDPVYIKGPPGGGGSGDYADLTNKPSINGVTLSGNKTTADLLISFSAADVGLGNVANERQYSAQNPPPYPVTSVDGKAGAVSVLPIGGTSGQVLKKASETNYDVVWADESGGGGSGDYADLTNKPSINGVTLSGNKTTADLLISFSAADVGLGNVANERQYSAQNPPPYPVTSVNGMTGAVVVPSLSDFSFIGSTSGSYSVPIDNSYKEFAIEAQYGTSTVFFPLSVAYAQLGASAKLFTVGYYINASTNGFCQFSVSDTDIHILALYINGTNYTSTATLRVWGR